MAAYPLDPAGWIDAGDHARRTGAAAADAGGFRAFCETHLFAAPLEQVATLAHRDALYAWAEGSGGDFARFVMISRALDLARLGGPACAISLWRLPQRGRAAVPARDVRRRDRHGRALAAFRDYRGRVPCLVSRGERRARKAAPVPDMSNPDAYSWCKAPRLDGRVAEVGALSRQLVAGHPLLRDMVAREGASVEARVVARVIEIALVTMAMEQWIAAIDPQAPFQDTSPRLDTGMRWA
jgi:hydrogenase large subunit